MALLDSMLAENFHAAYRQKRSGVLTAEGAATTMRFCFQDGSPVAIDLGDAKDRLLAYTLRDYNRLSEEQMQEVISAWEEGQAAVADLVVAHSYASEEEVGRSTQAMVEDSLCRFFAGKMVQVEFDDQKTIDGFDFDRQAFRLKIDAEVLLRTIDTRVAEIRTIQQEFGSFDGIFVFNEDSPGSGSLNEFEKRILDFVDGKTPVHQIAVSFRDSNLNTARTLAQLAQKKIIQRLATGLQSAPSSAPSTAQPVIGSGQVSASRQAVRTAIAEAALRQATPTMREFTPYRKVGGEEPRSRFMTVVLSLVLVLICAIAVLVYQYDQRRREFIQAKAQLEDAISHGDWNGARDQLDEARAKAGQDLSALNQVTEMEQHLGQAIEAELNAIGKLSDEGDHRQAGTRLSRLPANANGEAMRERVVRAEASAHRRSQELADRATEAIDRNDGAAAAALIASSPLIVREKAAALDLLDRWRVMRLEFAHSSGANYGKRVEALTKLKAAEPPERMAEPIREAETDIKHQEIRLREQLSALKIQVDQGAIEAAKADVERSGLAALVDGTPLATELDAIKARITEIESAIAVVIKSTTDALQAVDQPQRLTTVGDDLAKLASSPLPRVPAKAAACNLVIAEVGKIPLDQTIEIQIAALNPLFENPAIDPVLTDALRKRVERLRGLEGLAETSLENARSLVRDGKVDDAVTMLKELLVRPELRATQARAKAQQDVEELGARLARRAQLKEQLAQVIARGDVAAGTVIARELGLKYLPLAIETLPTGAELWHDGKQIGTSPLVLDISAADRVDYQIEARVSGYQVATTTGARAEAGWRLLIKLQRQDAITAKLGGLVTNVPFAVGNRVVAANRNGLGTVDAAAAVEWLAFNKEGVESPLYGAPTAVGDELLFATRDQVALSVRRDADGRLGVHRLPLSGRSDFPPAIHRSTLIEDRRYLIIAGLDGVVHATDDHDAAITWNGPAGAPFVTAPKVVGDLVMTVRRDGVIERIQADDGATLRSESLGVPVVTAWPTAKGFAGFTANELFEYDGETIVRSALPQSAAGGVENLLITITGRVLLRGATGDRSWDEVGRIDGEVSAKPLVWNGQAVLPLGKRLLVFGKRGFEVVAKADFLTPVILGERLVTVTQEGDVQQFDP